jgi:glyoxylase-like metal-dependent hydrolase (beta-lactamase superfamily II)
MNHMPRRVTQWAFALCFAWTASAASAGAPQAKGQAPGWYRMMVGDFEVTALSDGTVALPVDKLLTNTTPAKVQAALSRAYLKPPVETSVNGYLINTGAKLVLIDAGAAALFGPTLGNLVNNLKASGYQPEQVDEIYITHLHPDHVAGIASADGKAVFPNAVVRTDKREGDFWLSKEGLDKAPDAMKDFFKGAQASMKPYVDAGKYKPFDGPGGARAGRQGGLRLRPHAGPHDLRDREQGPEDAVLGRPDARGRGAVSRSRRDDPVRHRFQARRAATPEGLCRRREAWLLRGGGACRVSRHRPVAHRRQGLPLASGELLVEQVAR